MQKFRGLPFLRYPGGRYRIMNHADPRQNIFADHKVRERFSNSGSDKIFHGISNCLPNGVHRNRLHGFNYFL
jgi:hypothetical protein